MHSTVQNCIGKTDAGLFQSINQSIKFNSGSLAHVKRRHTHEKNNNKTLHYTIHYYYYSTTLHYQ